MESHAIALGHGDREAPAPVEPREESYHIIIVTTTVKRPCTVRKLNLPYQLYHCRTTYGNKRSVHTFVHPVIVVGKTNPI
jgi:hypothetical protein